LEVSLTRQNIHGGKLLIVCVRFFMFVYKVIGKLTRYEGVTSCVPTFDVLETIHRNRCSLVNIVNKLWSGGAGVDCQEGKEFFYSPACPDLSHSTSSPVDTGCFFQG
jgi:hypothetical protein